MVYQFDNVSFSMSTLASIVQDSLVSEIVKPKDTDRFPTLDDLIEYTVNNFARLDEMYEFISDQLGIYMRFDDNELVSMVQTTYEDVRSKIINIQLFKTVPYWWVIFPDKERLKEFLLSKIYLLASQMSFDNLTFTNSESDEIMPDEATLPKMLTNLKSGAGTIIPDDPESILKMLEMSVGEREFEGASEVINPHLKANTPYSGIETILKDIGETIINSPEILDNLMRVRETANRTLKSIPESSSASVNQVRDGLKNLVQEIDDFMDDVQKVRKNGVKPEDGRRLYDSLNKINTDMVNLMQMLDKISKKAPEIEKYIRQIFTPMLNSALQNLSNNFQTFNKLQQQVQTNSGMTNQGFGINPQQELSNVKNNIDELGEKLKELGNDNIVDYTRILDNIINLTKQVKELSKAKQKMLKVKLLEIIDTAIENAPPDVKITLQNIRKEVMNDE